MRHILLLIFTFLVFNTYAQNFADPVTIFHDPDVTLGVSISAADFDGDGKKDVLMCTAGMNVFYQKNLGNGQYGDPVVIFDEELFGLRAEPLDVDGDGDLDVIACVNFNSRVFWLENDGDGNFNSVKNIDINLDDLDDMVLADLDQDGYMDVVMSSYSFSSSIGQIFWYRNKGDGTFSDQKIIISSISDTRAITIADFNGDGMDDLLIATYLEDQLGWMPNQGGGNFGEIIEIDPEGDGYSTFASDIDNDGDVDLIIGKTFNIFIYENDGSGSFTKKTQELDFQITWDVATADIDSDGDQDILVGDSVDDEFDIFINDGTGYFENTESITSIEGIVNCIKATDMDSDGDIDILLSTSEFIFSYAENLINIPLSIDEEESTKIDLYPNPNNGKFSMNINDLLQMQIEFYDVMGMIVQYEQQKNGDEMTISLDVKPGIYFLRAYSKDTDKYSVSRIVIR